MEDEKKNCAPHSLNSSIENEHSILNEWDFHVTPFSPLSSNELNLPAEENAELEDSYSITNVPSENNEVALKNCQVQVRSLRSTIWFPFSAFCSWFSLPYKFYWLITVPKNVLASNDTCLIFQLVRKKDGAIIDNGLSMRLKSVHENDSQKTFKYTVNFTTCSHYHEKSPFYVQILVHENSTQRNQLLYCSASRMIYSRKKKTEKRKNSKNSLLPDCAVLK